MRQIIYVHILITFSLLTGFDITLNMVVLFSLILALGMLVDNGIVIVENIYRHMQQGLSRQEAAQVGTDQVAWPVITSTMTTLGAFLPMLFWPGIMGEFMGYLPMTLIMALSSSLFVALVINPVLSARLQTVNERDNPKYHSIIKRVEEKSGCPVIINTSFNVRGEPIVCAPIDAYKCFMRTEMDYLALGRFLLDKTEQPEFHDEIDWRETYELD